MQFVDLGPAFETPARIIAPDGEAACNSWRHHWEGTAEKQCVNGRRAVAVAARVQAQLQSSMEAH